MLKIRRDHIETEGQPGQIHKLPPSLDFGSDPPGIQQHGPHGLREGWLVLVPGRGSGGESLLPQGNAASHRTNDHYLFVRKIENATLK